MSKQVKKPAELTPTKISNVNLLPSGLATEPNKKMLDSTLDVMTSKGQMLPFKETFGIRTASNKVEEFFKVELDEVRRESQGNNMLVLRDSSDNYLGKASYYDIENYFGIKGNQLKDGVVLDKNINLLDLPVDPIKLTDYGLHYWLVDDLPLCRIHLNSTKFSIVDDLLGRPFASITDDITGNELELQNGMTVFFTGVIDNDYKTNTDVDNNLTEDPVIFYVYGVGKSIGLFAKTDIEARIPSSGLEKRPWDKNEKGREYEEGLWDGNSILWDSSQIKITSAEYVVQEKYSSNTNQWQAVDRWYHISTIRSVAKFLEINVEDITSSANKAKRPIISFSKDVKLYNWPTGKITEIHALLPELKSYYINKKNIKDQSGYVLKDKDLVVFEDTAHIWEIDNVTTGATFTQVTEAVNNDGAIIISSGTLEYYQVIYKNNRWQFAQNKITANQTPLFEFYTSDSVNIETLNGTDFRGGVILGFKDGATYDEVLGRYVDVSVIESESGLTEATPNQLNFITNIDNQYSYFDRITNEKITITGPYGYKSNDHIVPFYKNRSGLDFTKQVQDLLYTKRDDSPWTGQIAPVANGFTTIHIYHDEVDQYKFYFDIDGYGLVRFSGKTGTDLMEHVLPLVSGGLMKIVCHDLPETVTFYKTVHTNNITTQQAITSEYIINNGISNGTIEIDLNDGVVVDGVYIDNELAVQDTRLLWKVGSTYKIAYVKPLNNWTFLGSVFTKDQTNPLYNDYDFSLSDTILDDGSLSYFKQVNAGTGILNNSQTGDKICFGSIITNPTSKTAPLSLTINPLNEALSTINYYSLYQHATVLKSNSTNIKKFIDVTELTPTLLMGGGTLLKHGDPLTKTAVVATNLPFDFSDLLIKQGKHYDMFLSKLKSALEDVINTTDHTSYDSLGILNLALNKIYVVTPSDDLFWNHSNMIGWDNTFDDYRQADITVTSSLVLKLNNVDYNFEYISHSTGKESILHVTYNNKLLIRGRDYWLNSIGNKDNYTEIEFHSSLIGKTVNIKQWYTAFKSLVPASLAKIGLAPVYMPEILEDTTTVSSATSAYFKVTDGVGLNDFVIKLTDPVKIQSARDQLNNIVPKLHITGLIIKSTVDYNPNYSYHYDPDTIDFFEVSMEVCDATFDYTEEYLDEAGGAFLPGLRLCPWMSELLEEIAGGTTTPGKYFMHRHDSTRYYLKEGINSNGDPQNLIEFYLYEYEKAVWSSIAYDVEYNSQREILEGRPGYFRTKPNTWNQYRQTIDNEVRQWMLDNNIFVMENSNCDSTDGFTMKYQLGSGDEDVVVGSWRAIYKYMYDTDRPHTHPWEMLGYTIKPAWWDTHYSWIEPELSSISVAPDTVTWNVGLTSSAVTSATTLNNIISKRLALKRALRVGKISNPAEADVINPAFARNLDINNSNPDTLEDFPVDASGKLIPPNEFDTLLESNYLLLDKFEATFNWEAGDIGPYEQVFLSTQRGIAAETRAQYLLAPAQYVNLNWVPGQTVKNAWGHKVDKTTGFWQQGKIAHSYHRETVGNELVYTGGIESLYAEFCLLNNKDYVTEVFDKFNNIVVNKEFLLNGFTNKDNLRIQSTSISTQKNILFIPEENYQVRTVKHYPEREVFYSAMKIIFDGTNYSLNGFASEYGYFPYYVPMEGSSTSAVEVGSVIIKEKNTYTTVVNRVQYGTLFSNRQEIYDILVGYGKYLENMGIVYEEPEGGDIRNWQLSAKQFIFWSNDILASGSYINLNPCSDYIKITGQYGQLENLEGTNENVGQCVDVNNKSLFSKDLLVTRDVDNILIKTKKSDTGIYGIKLVFVNYESVVHLDSTSIFDDVYFSPSQSTTKRSFIIGGKKSINWTGAYYVPGYVFDGTSLIPNFDSMAELGRNLLDIESVIIDPIIQEASRAQFGLNRNPELRQLFLDEGNEVLFKNAITFNKGTTSVFNSLNSLTHQNGSETTAYEEYMVRLGEFGNTKNIEYYDFEMLSSDIINDAQIIKFTEKVSDDNNALYITNKSKRWVHKPIGKELNFKNEEIHSTLKKSGPIIEGDTDLSVTSLDDLANLYDKFIDLWSIPAFSDKVSYKINQNVRYKGQLYVTNSAVTAGTWLSNANKFNAIDELYLPNIFVAEYNKPNISASPNSGFTPGTWQVLQTMDNNLSIDEVCTGLTDVSKARVSTSVAHGLVVGDYVCIVNADTNSTSTNGIWKVVGLEANDPKQFYINTRILETIYTGKVFTFKPVRFKNQEDFNNTIKQISSISVSPNNVTWNVGLNSSVVTSAKTTSAKYNWQQKYETEYPLTPSGYDSRYPIAIVDDGLNNIDPVTFNYGNYKVYQLQPESDSIVVKKIEVKKETLPLKIDDIEHLIVYDYVSNKTLAKLELFAPHDLIVPQVFKDDIDITGRVDPAKYNRTTDKFKSIYTSLGWYEEYIGRRWWDTSSTQFNDYLTADDQVKLEYWGTTNNNTGPEIYEWTKSTVHPSQWEKLVTNKVTVFGQVATGQAYVDNSLGSDNYHWVEEEEYASGKAYTVYYFWVKNKKTIAQESKWARTYTVEQLSKVLLNPSAAGLAWWSPIDTNSILVKGIKPYLNSSSTVVQIKKKTKGEEKHQQWIFVSEGNTVETIPEWLHIRLRDSISGHVFYKNTITQSGWDSAPWGILWDSDGDQQVNFYTEKNVPDVENLHRYNLLGNSIRPYPQSWFGNLYEARRTFIKRLNELMSHVDINTITNWENSILMKPSYLVGDHEIDMTAFWKIGDFISEDYKPTKLIGKTIDNISNLYNENYAIGEYIRINNINNPKQYDIYEKTLAGGFNAVFRKNSAIQFIEEFNLYGFDAEAWDTDSIPWDYDINSVFNGIVDAARDEIFIGKNSKYYSSIMCSMFRYVLSEQINVDWLAKSSTVEPVNLISQTLSNKDYVKRDEIGAITDFYSTVKAYRDKLRGGTVNKIAVDTLNISIYEHINITDISNADNVAVGSSAGVIIPINISTDNVAVGGLTGFTIPMNISIT
jgi:hypothetical protein